MKPPLGNLATVFGLARVGAISSVLLAILVGRVVAAARDPGPLRTRGISVGFEGEGAELLI